MNSTAQPAIDPKLPTGPPLKTALKIVSRSPQTRASNAARAALVVADVTPTGYRVGLFMAGHARYATEADVRRNVVPGGTLQLLEAGEDCSRVSAVASGRSGAEFGPCAKRARSKSDGGCDRAKHRMFGFNPSYQASGLTSGLASGLIQNHVLNHRRTTYGSSRARVVCSVCGNELAGQSRIRDQVLQVPTRRPQQ